MKCPLCETIIDVEDIIEAHPDIDSKDDFGECDGDQSEDDIDCPACNKPLTVQTSVEIIKEVRIDNITAKTTSADEEYLKWLANKKKTGVEEERSIILDKLRASSRAAVKKTLQGVI